MSELGIIIVLFPAAAFLCACWGGARLCSGTERFERSIARMLMTTRIPLPIAIPLNTVLLAALIWSVLVAQGDWRTTLQVSEFLSGLAPHAQLAPICVMLCLALAHGSVLVLSTPVGQPKSYFGWVLTLFSAGIFLPYLGISVALLYPTMNT